MSRVSIPHRYAKNQTVPRENLVGYAFQFLIGTLKTVPSNLNNMPAIEFQFLIGTLKTADFDAPRKFEAMFQFLIGTLKTGLWFRS